MTEKRDKQLDYNKQRMTYDETLESLSEEERMSKRVRRDLSYLNKVFKGNLPKWMVDGAKNIYHRTKNQDLSKLKDGEVWKNLNKKQN